MNLFERLAGPVRGLLDRPYFLLTFTTLFWGGNVVAGRLAVGEVSPMVIVFLRWLIAFALLLVFAWRPIRAEYRKVLPHWPLVLLMGIFGYTGFNALFYSAAHLTEGVNIAIIQGSTPIVVLLLGFAVFRNALSPLQLLGALITVVGVLVTASHGDWRRVVNLAFNRGDLWMLIASVSYAVYTLMLRKRPDCSAIVFFAAMAAAACLTAIPLVVYEAMQGELLWPTAKGWLILIYIAVLPSMVCQIFYIRANEMIGAGRASVFYNLVPVFGAILSAVVLLEAVSMFDFLALGLVIGGILVAERR